MLTIRLSRIGKKNKPMYRLTVSEKSKDLYGRSLEILGSYNPHSKELQAKTDRIQYWISKGAGTSPTVNNLLIDKGIIKGDKIKASIARVSKKAPKKQPVVPTAPVEPAPSEVKETEPKIEETAKKIE
jgi:small subunit ribosomal protein S16